MSGLLAFSLGLNAGGFTSALSGANNRLKAFTASALSLPGIGTALGASLASIGSTAAVVGGVFKAIEKGAALEDLSKRTGVAVGEIYSLQRGFSAAGLAAEDAAPALFLMQRALGGVNEMGESTSDAFSRLGLSVGALKNLSGPQQLQAVLARIGRLNQTDAAKISSSIFGRSQAANMIQLARSTQEFGEAIKSSASQAALFERNAAAFEKIERGLAKLKNKTSGLFAGLAEGAAPGIQAVLDALNTIDLTGIGVQLGNILTAFGQAFREGKLAQLIGDTFKFGFEAAVVMAPVIFAKLGVALLKAFETPLIYLQTGMEWVIQQVMAGISKIPKLGEWMGLKDFKAQSFSEVLADRKETGLEFFTQGNTTEAMQESLNQYWDDQKEVLKGKWSEYSNVVQGFVARAPKNSADKRAAGKAGAETPASEPYKPEFTQFEKMGFVMSGMNNPATEYARSTAANTARSVALLEQLVAKPVGGLSVDNA